MRITGNFNIPKTNFRGIQYTQGAARIITSLKEEDDAFSRAYKKLESASDARDEDIYIQAVRGQGLNFQVIDSYTHETKYYLSADPNPRKSMALAVEKYNDFLTKQQPPRLDLPSRHGDQLGTARRGFFRLLGVK